MNEGTVLLVFIALYFIIKWAVRNGVTEAYKKITGKKTADDFEAEKMLNELGLDDKQ